MKRALALAAVVAMSWCSAKAETVFGAHLVSHHVGADGFNNANVGAYVVVDGWTVGAYRNSLYRTSIYAGYQFDWGPFSLTAGVVSGYKREVTECTGSRAQTCWRSTGFSRTTLAPMLVPSMHLGPARVWVIPSFGFVRNAGVLHLSVEGKF